MDSDNISIPPIEGARYIQWFFSHVGHKQNLRIGPIVGMPLDHLAVDENELEVIMRNSPQAHSPQCMSRDQVTVLPHSVPQRGEVYLGHSSVLF